MTSKIRHKYRQLEMPGKELFNNSSYMITEHGLLNSESQRLFGYTKAREIKDEFDFRRYLDRVENGEIPE